MSEQADPKATDTKAASPGVLRSSMIYSGFTLLSRFAGFARDAVMTAALGASSTIMGDAFYTAQSFPNLFRRIFAEGAFTAAFVPSYAAVLEKDGQEAADKLAADALATLAAATIALTLLVQITMPWLMYVINPGYADDPAKFKLAVILTQITMPYLPCMAIVALLSGVLNARGKFIVSAAVQIPFNLVTLLVVLPQKDPLSSAYAAAVGFLLAGSVQVAMLFWGIRRVGARIGFSVMPRLTPDIRNLLMLAVPGAAAAAATQINVFISQSFSSAIDGARSWLNVADRLYQLPLGLVGVAIGVALLPALSRAVQSGDHDRAQKTMDQAMVYSMIFALPAIAALIAMPYFLIDGLYQRGIFHEFDARKTAECLFHYGWGVPAFVLTRILNPAFFARKDTFGPMKFAFVSVVVNLAVGIGLFQLIAAPGLAVGTSAAAWVNVVLMVVALARRGDWIMGRAAFAQMMKAFAAATGAGAFFFVCERGQPAIEGLINSLLPGGLFGVPFLAGKEIGIVGVCFVGLMIYIALLVAIGAVRPSDLKAALRRGKA